MSMKKKNGFAKEAVIFSSPDCSWLVLLSYFVAAQSGACSETPLTVACLKTQVVGTS